MRLDLSSNSPVIHLGRTLGTHYLPRTENAGGHTHFHMPIIRVFFATVARISCACRAESVPCRARSETAKGRPRQQVPRGGAQSVCHVWLQGAGCTSFMCQGLPQRVNLRDSWTSSTQFLFVLLGRAGLGTGAWIPKDSTGAVASEGFGPTSAGRMDRASKDPEKS